MYGFAENPVTNQSYHIRNISITQSTRYQVLVRADSCAHKHPAVSLFIPPRCIASTGEFSLLHLHVLGRFTSLNSGVNLLLQIQLLLQIMSLYVPVSSQYALKDLAPLRIPCLLFLPPINKGFKACSMTMATPLLFFYIHTRLAYGKATFLGVCIHQ